MSRRRFAKFAPAGLFVAAILGLLLADGFAAAGKAEDAKKYAEQLKTTKDAKKKIEALEELGKLGQIMKSFAEPAADDIKKSLKDKDAGVRKAAAEAYGKIDPDPKEAVPALTGLLKDDSDESVKIGAIRGLASMGTSAKDALADLKGVVKDADKKSKLGKEAGNAIKSINPKKKP